MSCAKLALFTCPLLPSFFLGKICGQLDEWAKEGETERHKISPKVGEVAFLQESDEREIYCLVDFVYVEQNFQTLSESLTGISLSLFINNIYSWPYF